MPNPKILISPDGKSRFIYSDEVASVMREVGTLNTKRASHVEPNEDGEWMADLSPVGGPLLGPFETRAGALAAESVWIDSNNIPIPEA